MEPVVKQRFRFAETKEELTIYYTNADETEVIRFTLYLTVRHWTVRYYIEVHKYVDGLYTKDFISRTLFYKVNMAGYTIGEALKALKKAIQRYTNGYVIDSLWIKDEDLLHKAGITFDEENLNERLQKLFNLASISPSVSQA